MLIRCNSNIEREGHIYKTKILKSGDINKHSYKKVKIINKEPLKNQAEYFLEGINERKIEINNSDHALKVVNVLEECSTKMRR